MTEKHLKALLLDWLKAYLAPVSTGAKITLEILRDVQPCQVRVSIAAVPSKQPKVLARFRDVQTFIREWIQGMPDGSHLHLDFQKVSLESGVVTFKLNLAAWQILR